MYVLISNENSDGNQITGIIKMQIIAIIKTILTTAKEYQIIASKIAIVTDSNKNSSTNNKIVSIFM